ncbi:putative NAD dependent epimerase/dehydratase [Bisporella sp. PMI_857]|nr:putative NAD dependent epimerase/dehydratase [Bisporella sp. PMI_857]
MADPATTIPKGSWVLVTGANGFVAAHVTRELLQRGYKVRGTVRDLEKSSWLVQDVFKSYANDGKFELVLVPDLAAENAFGEAVEGMSAIIHVANFIGLAPDPNEVIPQTVASNISILHAALDQPSVKAFVYTSSVGAATMPGSSTHIERNTWNEDALKLAWAPPPYDPMRTMVVYYASKVETERAIWKFVDEKKPHFSVNSISPGAILGEPLAKKHLETPYSFAKALYDGNTSFLAVNPSTVHVDVKDVALLHVAAVLDPEVKNARLQAWAGYCDWNDVLAIIRKLCPHRKLPDDFPPSPPLPVTTDLSQPLALLKKWGNQGGWKSLEETVVDNMKNIVAWYP